MIRITYISAIDGKAATRTYKTHVKAVDDWNVLIAPGGYVLAATMTSAQSGAVMRAHCSGAFLKATERSTWAS